MEIVNRINANLIFRVDNTSDELNTHVLHSKHSSGIGSVVVCKNKDNPTAYDVKIVLGPRMDEEADRVRVCNAFLMSAGLELSTHEKLFKLLYNVPIVIFVEPTIFCKGENLDEDQAYLFTTMILASLRMMNDHTEHKCHSGIIH